MAAGPRLRQAAGSRALPGRHRHACREATATTRRREGNQRALRGKLAREQIAGHLAADLLGIELLEEESLRLGESVRKAAIAFTGGDAKLRNATSALKSKLKQKALKDPEGTAEKLRRLDSDLDVAARSKLKQANVTLNGLPDAKSVIVERKPKSGGAALTTVCRGCTHSLRSDEQPTPLQSRFGTPCPCVWGPDEAHLADEPQPISKGAVARARAEWEQWRAYPEAGRAIALVDQLENLYDWLEDTSVYLETAEPIDWNSIQ